MISKESLEKFKKLYKDRFNIELSERDALEKAIKLRRIVEITYKPITLNEYKDYLERRLKVGAITEEERQKLLKDVKLVKKLKIR